MILWLGFICNYYLWILWMLLPICIAQCHEHVAPVQKVSSNVHCERWDKIKSKVLSKSTKSQNGEFLVKYFAAWEKMTAVKFLLPIWKIIKKFKEKNHRTVFSLPNAKNMWFPVFLVKRHVLYANLKVSPAWNLKTFEKIYNLLNWAHQHF